MEKEGLISIFNLADKCQIVNMIEFFRNRVTTECLGAFNPDGSMRKTQKSQTLEKFSLTPVTYSRNYI